MHRYFRNSTPADNHLLYLSMETSRDSSSEQWYQPIFDGNSAHPIFSPISLSGSRFLHWGYLYHPLQYTIMFLDIVLAHIMLSSILAELNPDTSISWIDRQNMGIIMKALLITATNALILLHVLVSRHFLHSDSFLVIPLCEIARPPDQHAAPCQVQVTSSRSLFKPHGLHYVWLYFPLFFETIRHHWAPDHLDAFTRKY